MSVGTLGSPLILVGITFNSSLDMSVVELTLMRVHLTLPPHVPKCSQFHVGFLNLC